MTSDLDIYRSAKLLVKQHGEDAPIHVAMRADAMLEAGDLDGYAVSRVLLRAVGELQGTEPGCGARVLGARSGCTRPDWLTCRHVFNPAQYRPLRGTETSLQPPGEGIGRQGRARRR